MESHWRKTRKLDNKEKLSKTLSFPLSTSYRLTTILLTYRQKNISSDYKRRYLQMLPALPFPNKSHFSRFSALCMVMSRSPDLTTSMGLSAGLAVWGAWYGGCIMSSSY